MIYLIIIVLLLFLSINYDVNGRKKSKDFWCFVVLVLFTAVAGMRYKLGLDTARYLYHFYHDVPKLWDLAWEDLSYGSDPLFKLLNSTVLSLGGRFYVVQFIQSAFVNILVFKYIKRHTPYIFTALFFYFIWQYYGYNMEEMRAGIALVICLFANDYCLEKKWIKAIALYMIASLFHFSAIICIVTPLLLRLRFNFVGLLVAIAVFVAGVFVAPYIEENMYMLEFSDAVYGKVMGYMDDEMYTESGLNIFGYITSIMLYAYPVYSILNIKKRDKNNPLLQLEPFLLIAILVAILNLRLPLAYRFIHFYALYFILFVTDLSMRLMKNTKGMSRSMRLGITSVILFPMVYLMVSPNFNVDMYSRFLPYTSVIEKSVDIQRERTYSKHGAWKTYPNEY